MKVDMSIIRNIDREERKPQLVELLTRFARATSSRLIVEGIGTSAEAATVRRIGVDLLQGYLVGRPSLRLPGVD
jgi:EAL domain-containing protein (putative c-di-GMP-specific phosphodiesterase class I)